MFGIYFGITEMHQCHISSSRGSSSISAPNWTISDTSHKMMCSQIFCWEIGWWNSKRDMTQIRSKNGVILIHRFCLRWWLNSIQFASGRLNGNGLDRLRFSRWNEFDLWHKRNQLKMCDTVESMFPCVWMFLQEIQQPYYKEHFDMNTHMTIIQI